MLSHVRICFDSCHEDNDHPLKDLFDIIKDQGSAAEGSTSQRLRRTERLGKHLRLSAACVAKYCDWSWFKQALGLRGWSGEVPEGKLCWLCQAGHHNEFPCWEFSLAARWRCSMTTMPKFWEEVYSCGAFCQPHMLYSWISYLWCIPDFMHTACLGIVQYASETACGGGVHSRPTKACGLLNNMITIASKSLGVPKPFACGHDEQWYQRGHAT